jgi:hypothetical protein
MKHSSIHPLVDAFLTVYETKSFLIESEIYSLEPPESLHTLVDTLEKVLNVTLFEYSSVTNVMPAFYGKSLKSYIDNLWITKTNPALTNVALRDIELGLQVTKEELSSLGLRLHGRTCKKEPVEGGLIGAILHPSINAFLLNYDFLCITKTSRYLQQEEGEILRLIRVIEYHHAEKLFVYSNSSCRATEYAYYLFVHIEELKKHYSGTSLTQNLKALETSTLLT